MAFICSELLFVRLLFEGGGHLRAAPIQRKTVCSELFKVPLISSVMLVGPSFVIVKEKTNKQTNIKKKKKKKKSLMSKAKIMHVFIVP